MEKLNDIEERGYEYSSVQDFYDRVKTDIRQAGSVDTYHTLQDALDKINGSEALSRQYAEWRESLAGKYGIKEVLLKVTLRMVSGSIFPIPWRMSPG